MRFYGALILAALFAIGCSRSPVSPPTSSATNSVYQMGFTEGQKHAIERPTYSAMLFPRDYTNWPAATQELYRSGYVAGLGSVK
jgi:hypothetical protein